MNVYLLVHGAWQSSGCWDKVASKLRADGLIIFTPDLLWGKTIGKPDQSQLSRCIDFLIESIQNSKSIIAVGHSI